MFDLDGTLIDSQRLYSEAYERAFRDAGIDWSPSIRAALRGTSRAERRNVLARYCRSDVLAETLAQAAVGHFDGATALGIPLCEGLARLLASLREQAVPLAVVTSAGRDYTERHLASNAIRQAFRCVVTREDVSSLKPSPEPFVVAARCLGVPPAHCLVLEDTAPGLAGARAAGMTAIPVRTRATEPQNDGYTIASIEAALARALGAGR